MDTEPDHPPPDVSPTPAAEEQRRPAESPADETRPGEAASGKTLAPTAALPPDASDFESLCKLADERSARFDEEGDIADIEEAVKLRREALVLRPVPHTGRAHALHNLAVDVSTRGEELGHQEDIDEAIALYMEALVLQGASHRNRGTTLGNLASVFRTRFALRGDLADLNEAIDLNREVLSLRPAPHLLRDRALNNLANAIGTRYEQQGDPRDVDEAIALFREAVTLLDASSRNHSHFISNLANTIFIRFELTGDLADINEAIAMHREALALRAAPHPDHGSSLDGLADALQVRFMQRGSPGDIDEAIRLHRESVALRAATHPYRPSSLLGLAGALRLRFGQQGVRGDINEAIALHREALSLLPPTHPDRGSSLNNLAIAIGTRFVHLGDHGDIDELISLLREGLAHPLIGARDSLLNNLATAIELRFEQRGDPADIDEAITLHAEVVALRPPPHPYRAGALSQLASGILTRFERRDDPADIDEAVKLHREALASLPATTNPDRSRILSSLGHSLRTRFEQRGIQGDIDEAIELYEEVVALRPSPNPARSSSLNNLAGALRASFEKQGTAVELDHIVELYRQAATYQSSPLSSRFLASTEWAQCATKHNHNTILAAYQQAINLLPELAALDLDIASRQQRLTGRQVTALAADSATAAIAQDRAALAVEFLEASRSIFWSQALQLRTPLDKLLVRDWELGDKLRNISRQLDQSAFRDSTRAFDTSSQGQQRQMSIEDEGTRLHELDEDRRATLAEIRKISGFEDFLLPKKLDALRQAAGSGPVVVLLAQKSGSSALILEPSGGVQHVELPTWTPQKFELCADLPRILSDDNHEDVSGGMEARDFPSEVVDLGARLFGGRERVVKVNPDERLRRYLAELWTSIVKPVVVALGLKKSERPPRLWWCPTGRFAFLPIHAAGVYNIDTADCVSDYAISSYTPTLTALLDPPQTTALFKMTAICEPHAPGSSSLPGTAKEMEMIEKHVPKEWLTSLWSPESSDAVRHLLDSSLVHFACHGVQDSGNPLDSALLLADGRLKVSGIMRRQASDVDEGNTGGKPMSLAFLSACQTAMGDKTTPDEMMHLAAALLFAGFRSVVATMWTIADEDGPKVADAFYDYLFRDCDPSAAPPRLPDLTKAAEALHFAVLKLRKEPDMSFARWVPFVHHGL